MREKSSKKQNLDMYILFYVIVILLASSIIQMQFTNFLVCTKSSKNRLVKLTENCFIHSKVKDGIQSHSKKNVNNDIYVRLITYCRCPIDEITIENVCNSISICRFFLNIEKNIRSNTKLLSNNFLNVDRTKIQEKMFNYV